MGAPLLRCSLKLRHISAVAAANTARLSPSSPPFLLSSSPSSFSTSLLASLFSTSVPHRTCHLMGPFGVRRALLPQSQLMARWKSSEMRMGAPAMPVKSKLDKYEIRGYSSDKQRFEVLNYGTIQRFKEGNTQNAHAKLAIWIKERKKHHLETLFLLGKFSSPCSQSCRNQFRAANHILMNSIPFSSSVGRNPCPKFAPFPNRFLRSTPLTSCGLHCTPVGCNPCSKIAPFRTWVTLSAARANEGTPRIADFSLDYLAKACGFAKKEDIKATLGVAYTKDLENSLLVLDFLKENGFDKRDVGKVLSGHPRILRANVDKTLRPKIQALRDAAFSQVEIVQMVSAAPCALHVNVAEKIKLLKSLFGTNKMVLKVTKRNPNLLSSSHHDRLLPNLAILKACGVPAHRLPIIMLRSTKVSSQKIIRTRETIDLVQKFGFTPGSNMFDVAFCVIGRYPRAMIDAKCMHFRNLGMSKEEVLFAVGKCPSILCISKKEIERKFVFLRDELHLETSYISQNPLFLLFSLENRLKPRHCVLQALKMKGILVRKYSLASVMRLTDHVFSDKFISPFLEKFSEIGGNYLTSPKLRS